MVVMMVMVTARPRQLSDTRAVGCARAFRRGGGGGGGGGEGMMVMVRPTARTQHAVPASD